MHLLSVINTYLNFHFCAITYAATIPTWSSLSNTYPTVNQTALQVFRPWPPPPFNIRSTDVTPWLLHIRSYEPLGRLTYRQIHAMLDLCVSAQDILKSVSPDHRMQAKNYVFRATQREPYDLTQEDVEVVFFNGGEEPGEAHTALSMYIALDIMMEKLLPSVLSEMRRAIMHYADVEPRKGNVAYKRLEIRRKSGGRVVALTW